MITGILGGTFDPIHLGHLHIARQVVTRLGLQAVQFMPCALPVHRADPHASAQQRCALIELAIADNPAFSLNRIELQCGQPSYTVDSLRRMRATADYPLASQGLALILGADAFNGFADWKAPQRILELAHLVVCCRPGFDVDDGLFAGHRVDSFADLRQRSAGGILVLLVDAIDCSSSQVRAALQQGQSAHQYLGTEVADYINEHNLYRKLRD